MFILAGFDWQLLRAKIMKDKIKIKLKQVRAAEKFSGVVCKFARM